MSVALARAAELTTPPPKGTPYSIALEGTEQHGRTKIYRHWQHKDGLLTTLDPKITTTHELFEQTGMSMLYIVNRRLLTPADQRMKYPMQIV